MCLSMSPSLFARRTNAMILDFSDENGKRHFEFCFVGFISGGCLQSTKGMQVLRTELSLFEKLESISEPKPCGKKLHTGEPDRQLLSSGPKSIHVDQTELGMLYDYLSTVPWQTGTPVRYAVETIYWLQEAGKRG